MDGQVLKERIAEFRKVFKSFDKDRDGKVTFDELFKVMESLGYGISRDELKRLAIDNNKDGNKKIDFSEFLNMMTSRETKGKEMYSDDEMKEAFGILDMNGNGTIGASELRDILSNIGETMTESEIAVLLKRVDSNADGRITFDEFVMLLKT